MILSALADIIYNAYLVLYYILKISAFVGCLLFDIIQRAASIVLCCSQNVKAFVKIVSEDNHHLFRDIKSIIDGTSTFFIDNVIKVYNTGCFILATFLNALSSLMSLVGLTFATGKRSLVLIGEAVWFLFTLPHKLMLILDQLMDVGREQVVELAKNTFRKAVDVTATIGHYAVHDVPFEALCGLLVLAIAFLNPYHTKIILVSIGRTARYMYGILFAKIEEQFHRVYNRTINLCQYAVYVMIRIYTPIRSHALWIYDNEFLPVFYRVSNLLNLRQREELEGDRRNHTQDRITAGLFLLRIPALVYSAFMPVIRYIVQIKTRPNPRNLEPDAPAHARSSPTKVSIGTCIICEDNERAIAFVPCGHLCVCKRCAINLCYHNPVCPLCRKYIEKKLHVFV